MPTTNTYKNRDVISMHNLNKSDIMHVLKHAEVLKKKESPQLLSGYTMGNCFFEPSTRTRFSFESAMQKLGGKVIGFYNQEMISTKKGESLSDTIRSIGSYVDVIILRHPLEGSAQLAAESTTVPVINAGDGSNQHPTQTLLDLFSIKECQGQLDNLSIALVGDLKHGRTTHSLAQALTHFKARLYFVSPENLEMPEHVCDDLRKNGIKFSFHKHIEQIIPKIDILYLTRLQKERLYPSTHSISIENCMFQEKYLLELKRNCKILHPLPRLNELPKEIDTSTHAYYFEQVENGLYVRQALLGLLLSKL
jgi:aspartate carbamoyltransferase catalytic subunit